MTVAEGPIIALFLDVGGVLLTNGWDRSMRARAAERFALDLAQTPPERVAYVEDRPMFVEVARGLRIRGIHHTGHESTRRQLATLGLDLSG